MENEITINNLKYYSEEKYLKDLKEIQEKLDNLINVKRVKTKQFSYKTQIKLIKAMESLGYRESDELIDYDKSSIAISEPCNILMIESLTEESRNFLINFADNTNLKEDFEISKFWDNDLIDKSRVFAFSNEYLNKALNLLNITCEVTKIKVKELSFPIILENKYFRIILAPRLEEGDEDKMWGLK